MKIRTRLFLVFVAALGITLYFLLRWVSDDLRSRYNESFEEPLVDIAQILAETVGEAIIVDASQNRFWRRAFDDIERRRFNARVFDLTRDRVDMRVYVTDRTGVVMFDSHNGRDEGNDYSRWNDVMLTLRGEYGTRSTRGDPLYPTGSVAYVAAPILADGEVVGVVSVGKPKRHLAQFLAAARRNLLAAGLVAATIAIALGFVLYYWVSLPLERLTRYALAIKTGERARLPVLGNNEIGEVGVAMEAMREALEGKDYIERYTHALTHEFKSPLTAIRGAVELMDEPMPEDERRRFSTVIRRETHRLQELVDRILLLADLENRNTLDRVEPIVLDSLIRDVVDSLETSAHAKQVTIDLALSPSAAVTGERFLLRQAITNLLQNAIDHAPRGTTVTIRGERRDGRVTLSVHDRGPGVPDFALDKVFDRFYSLARPGSGDKGTGLGLNLVKEVAILHGGNAALINADGGGALATLALPALE